VSPSIQMKRVLFGKSVVIKGRVTSYSNESMKNKEKISSTGMQKATEEATGSANIYSEVVMHGKPPACRIARRGMRNWLGRSKGRRI